MKTIWDIIIEILPLLGVFSFVKAIIEYRKSQLWKESEFLSSQAKEFFSDQKIKTVLTLLDWNSRKIIIDDKEVKIDDDIMIEALKTHNKKNKFSATEAHIRDLFDNFFDRLSYFNIHCKNGLVSQEKVFNYFEYYFNILITTDRKNIKFINTIENYLKYYDYTNVLDLLEKYKVHKNQKSKLNLIKYIRNI